MKKENIAFLFAGQGSQKAGMALDLYENIQECKDVIDEGEKVLKMPIKEIMFGNDEDVIKETENAQPAILLMSIAILKALEKEGIEADYSAGLSLGEYSALVYSNVLSIKDALEVVKERGRIMGSSLPKNLGKMAAIVKLNNSDIDKLISECSKYGIIEGVNYNCPGQVVVAGENEAIDKAIGKAKELGGKAIELKVSGPFHSSLLKNASEDFYKFIKEIKIGKISKNIYSNYKGELYNNEDDVKLILKNHIMSPVYFEKIIRDMLDKGVDTFIEIGPGKALSGFVKKIDRKVKVYNVENLKTLKETVSKLKEV